MEDAGRPSILMTWKASKPQKGLKYLLTGVEKALHIKKITRILGVNTEVMPSQFQKTLFLP